MRIIPVRNLVVVITIRKVIRRGRARWRGHWSIHAGQASHRTDTVAEGDTHLFASEENAYLFAGTEGVAMAKEIMPVAG
jgi:hypothetical protein